MPPAQHVLTHHMCPLEACRETWLLYWNAGCSLDNTGSCKGSGKIAKARPAPHTPGPRTDCQFIGRMPPSASHEDCLPVPPPTAQPLTRAFHSDSGKESLRRNI